MGGTCPTRSKLPGVQGSPPLGLARRLAGDTLRGPREPLSRSIRTVGSDPNQAQTTMAKSKKKKEIVFLVCEETGDKNYTLLRRTGQEKLSLKKYCKRLRRHTIHIEKKK